MSEAWKNRLWSLVLVSVFAVVLSVCQQQESSSGGSGSGIAYAYFKPSDVSEVMYCTYQSLSSGVRTFKACDSSDNTSLDSSDDYSITLANLVTAGFRPCKFAGTVSHGYNYGQFVFCK